MVFRLILNNTVMKNLGFKSWAVLAQLSFFIGFISCDSPNEAQLNVETEIDSAKWVIEQSVNAHGVLPSKYKLSFDFRDKSYQGDFKDGLYSLSREYNKGDSAIKDVLTNDSFVRYINSDSTVTLEERNQAYSNSINSVFYFTLLPWKLQDPAVNTEYLGVIKHNSGKHYAVRVTFNQEGGGEDFEDQFVYWFNTQTNLLDFFAYSYNTNGGGVRFRTVEYRHTTASGQIFQDYINYKHEDLTVDMLALLGLFNNQELVELSKIRLRNLTLTKAEKLN